MTTSKQPAGDAARSSPPFRLGGIEHILLLVNDMERALAFYEGVLGANVESRLPQHGMVELRAGASHLDLVDTSVPQGAWARPPVGGGRNVDHVGVRLESAHEESLRRHLAAHGVAIAQERINEDAGIKSLSLYVSDPSGNTIELMS
jgi:glyoxylase I family protein